MELDHVLRAGHDRGDDLARGRRLGHPRRGALDVVEDRAAEPHGAQQVGQGVSAHRPPWTAGASRRTLGKGRRTFGKVGVAIRTLDQVFPTHGQTSTPAPRHLLRERGPLGGRIGPRRHSEGDHDHHARRQPRRRATTTRTRSTAGPDLAAIKARQQATWASGDFGQIGVRLQIVGESLCEAVDLLATDKVLDVAAGNGNASLAAARRFADVTSTDYVPALLEQGRRRAEADRLPITFQVADAEALPFADESFDVVLSTFGVMFAPNQERAASELLRVVKPGGRIGLANWTPDGFIGRLFEVMSALVPPPAGLRSPMEWGTEPRLVELFGPQATDIRTTRRTTRSATARPSTGSRSSGPTTARRTRRSARSTRRGSRRSTPRCWSSWAAGTGATAPASAFRATTSRSW